MINSVNTLDVIKPKILNVDKFNVTSAAASVAARLHHQNASQLQSNITPTRDYIKFIRKTFPIANSESATSPIQERQERVKVQHLENHTKLQNNNCWNNFRTLYNLSASSTPTPLILKGGSKSKETNTANLKADDLNRKQQQQSNMDLKTKSAFNIEINKHRYIYSNNNSNLIIKTTNNINNNSLTIAASEANNNNNNYLNAKQQQQGNNIFINREQQSSVMIVGPPHRRTEDQEHAYRRIESVHNYAKLKTYDDDEDNEDSTPNGSRHSSNLEDDDDEEDDEDDGEDEDYEENNIGGKKRSGVFEEDDDLDADYEDILNRRRLAKINKNISNKSLIEKYHHSTANSQPHEDEIDVETVEQPNDNNHINNINIGPYNESSVNKPEHHARRPMNAFLIFCKRHRAIVKERYKTLENRAITKILGDWWASLEANDKECFTNLAQQNKDAFFSANPNFKWYKLPAPPLRTLSTRPANGHTECENYTGIESICQNTRSNCNMFKLADEAQMGDLSQLMQDKSRHRQCAALQQALGETSHFMSTHLMGGETEPRQYNENSNFSSSNSSEDDGLVPKIKSSRSCKGKRYQELINSGQITAPAVKKLKTSQQRLTGDAINLSSFLQANIGQNVINSVNAKNRNEMQRLQDSDNGYAYDTYAPFDLEEKIKELPALCLDDYLQRKRNTKKKKKFSSHGKKKGVGGLSAANRNYQSKTLNLNTKKSPNTTLATKMPQVDMMARLQQRKQLHQQQQAMVGSQKRKARKESITRRDVSAIEQEVASLLPLTINGCCYFQEAPIILSPAFNNDIVQKDIKSDIFSRQTTSPIIPMITATTSISSSPLSLSSSAMHSSVSASGSSSSVSPASPQPAAYNSTSDFKNSDVAISNYSDIMKNIEKSNETINDNISSSTSDLLILAEVAANRTEFKH